MTGTAATESQEFESIYKLKVTVVPTNKPMIRKDESDVVFRATNGKWRAAVVEISRMNKVGRPVLVGTTSVEQSETLSEQLHEAGIPHEVCLFLLASLTVNIHLCWLSIKSWPFGLLS
jgi:preprotein translocase subunit SecA